MSDASHTPTDRSIVYKDLAALDRTGDGRLGHYSREDVAEACHATGGQDHE
jgi:hypothetical protein